MRGDPGVNLRRPTVAESSLMTRTSTTARVSGYCAAACTHTKGPDAAVQPKTVGQDDAMQPK